MNTRPDAASAVDLSGGPVPERPVELPEALAQLIEDFASMAPGDRLQGVIDAGVEAGPLPDHVLARREQMEPVKECQSPVFLLVDVEDGGVHVYVDAPAHSPTTRGYASLLSETLDGQPPSVALAVPTDLPQRMGLDEVISPLRLSGMQGLGRRLRRQVAIATGQAPHEPTGSQLQQEPGDG